MTEKNLYDLNYLLSQPVLAAKNPTSALIAVQSLEGNGPDDQMDDAESDVNGEGEWIGLE